MQLEDIPALRSYLASKLASLYVSIDAVQLTVHRDGRSDADPLALADYIIALLKHEKPPAELKAFCTSQLVDFLHEHTTAFVDRLFQRIETGRDFEEKPAEPARATAEDIAMAPSETRMSVTMQPPTRPMERMQQHDQHIPMRDHSRSYSDEEEGERHYRPRRGEPERHRNRSRSPSASRHHGGSQPNQQQYGYGRPVRGYQQRTLSSGLRSQPGRYAPRGGRMVGNAPMHQRSETRLVIDRIPAEFCSISAVNEYFQRFGSVVNITVQPEYQRARIEYATKEQANAAYTSPEVIFGNRFVKVFWDHEDYPSSSLPPSAQAALAMPRRLSQSSSGPMPMESSSSQPGLRVDAAAARRQEALRGMLELQKQKQELLVKYISQQKELLQKLESKSLPEAERQEMLASLRAIDDLIKTLKVSGFPESPEKKPSLSSSASPSPHQTHQPILRGGPVQRGRGGSLVSRGAHRLDLRPTALLLNPVPARVGKDIGAIRKLFEPYGEIKNVTLSSSDPQGAIVSFARRPDAEKAMQYISKTDLGEPFQLEWHQASSSSSSSPSPSPPLHVSSNPSPPQVGSNVHDQPESMDHIAFEEDPMTA